MKVSSAEILHSASRASWDDANIDTSKKRLVESEVYEGGGKV